MTNKVTFYKLLEYIKPFKGTFLLGMIFLFLSSIASLLFPWLVGQLVDQTNQNTSNINKIAVMLFALFTAQAFFSYFRIVLFINVTSKALEKLRSDSFKKLITLPISFYSERRIGELCSRIASDIELLKNTFTSDLAQFLRQIIIISGGIGLLAITSIQLTLFMLCTLPVVVLIAIYFGRKLRKYSKEVQDVVAESNTIVEESLQAIHTIKTLTSEFFQISRYNNKVKKVATMSIRVGKLKALFASFIIIGIFGSIVAVIWFGTSLIQSENMSIGELFSFVLYSVFIAASIGGIAELYASLQKAIGATEKLLNIQNEKSEKITNIQCKEIKGDIEFKRISFSYPSRKNNKIINNMSLKIKSGDQIGIVGTSGCGKTTITKLLLRLHDVCDGEILIDNQNINNFSLFDLRRQIGIVPQDIILFAASIKENLLYAKRDASEEEIISAAKQANAHDFILKFEDGYNTLVGERGIELSGGQRQRIAIARVILQNPKIVIFDEATSSLDAKSEELIQESMTNLLKNRTSIIISHRFSSIQHVKNIFVISNGQIIQSGSHKELISKDGHYRELASFQF